MYDRAHHRHTPVAPGGRGGRASPETERLLFLFPTHAGSLQSLSQPDPLPLSILAFQPFTGTSPAAALRAIAAATPADSPLVGPEWGWAAEGDDDPLAWRGVSRGGAGSSAVVDLSLADAAAVAFPPGALVALAPALTSLRLACCGLPADSPAL